MKVIIYGKTGCNDCQKAKLLCDMRSLDYQYLQLGEDYSLDELPSSVKSMPLIYIKEHGDLRVIGGYEELRKLA